MKIWIVFGQTGEYSEHEEWTVNAYRSEEAAQARILQLGALKRQGRTTLDRILLMRSHKLGDPGYSEEYTDTTYYYSAVELVEES